MALHRACLSRTRLQSPKQSLSLSCWVPEGNDGLWHHTMSTTLGAAPGAAPVDFTLVANALRDAHFNILTSKSSSRFCTQQPATLNTSTATSRSTYFLRCRRTRGRLFRYPHWAVHSPIPSGNSPLNRMCVFRSKADATSNPRWSLRCTAKGQLSTGNEQVATCLLVGSQSTVRVGHSSA